MLRRPCSFVLLTLAFCFGCARHRELSFTPAEVDPYAPDGAVLIPGDCPWVNTGIEVRAGQAVTIEAAGTIQVTDPGPLSRRKPVCVGPEGTYLYSPDVLSCEFPLPAAAGGPAPPYCLIGRIGDGPPFYVGPATSFRAERSGALALGVNDFDVSDNSGRFLANVTIDQTVRPLTCEEVVSGPVVEGGPAECCSVVVFYLDGLRPDVIREMALMGHIPQIARLFVHGGAWLANAFTVFPSDTTTSNGTMWTGCFSDRHGVKGQVRFSRRTLVSESYMEPLGPSRSARVLSPAGVDRVIHETGAAVVGTVRGAEAERRFRGRRVSGVTPIYAHLRECGTDWATGVLPVMTETPPPLWARSMARHLPYLHAHLAWQYVDDANTDYALSHLLARRAPVTIVWLPETDSVSHKRSRGQFGVTRRTIAQADRLIGRMVEDLRRRGRLERTYFILVSDHGHHGGRDGHLSNFDLAHELFYRPRRRGPEGAWVGGGLGLSVRQHRVWVRHKGNTSRQFVFLDADSDGAARIFLPRGGFQSGDWSGPNDPGSLLCYPIADDLPPVNLIETLTGWTTCDSAGCCRPPIDLVLMKLSECSILVANGDRGYAVIERRYDPGCPGTGWRYRYTPVENVRPGDDGGVEYDVPADGETDPLRLIGHVPAGFLKGWHDEQTWLRATATSAYPDSVVVLTRHMLWQENLRHREREFAPDLVVTARPGWYFGVESSPGTMHGHPLPDAMRATLFVSGPNVRCGARITEPCRLADLTPTMLEMTGHAYDPCEYDGEPIRTIYAAQHPGCCQYPGCLSGTGCLPDGCCGTAQQRPARCVNREPVYWEQADLRAWHTLCYRPLPPSAYKPLTVNKPFHPLDLNNLAYDAILVSELSVLRIIEDVISPLTPAEFNPAAALRRGDLRVRAGAEPWLAEAAQALNLSGAALADYSQTSQGNLRRASGAIDWLQHRSLELESASVVRVTGRRLPASRMLHAGIDGAQTAFWETYLFAQRVLAKVMDEWLINGVENATDQALNAFRRGPADLWNDQ